MYETAYPKIYFQSNRWTHTDNCCYTVTLIFVTSVSLFLKQGKNQYKAVWCHMSKVHWSMFTLTDVQKEIWWSALRGDSQQSEYTNNIMLNIFNTKIMDDPFLIVTYLDLCKDSHTTLCNLVYPWDVLYVIILIPTQNTEVLFSGEYMN